MESATIPPEVLGVLKTTSIGYLTTVSKKGELYSYPVAFYYSDFRVYFVTPVSAAKYRMIRENPTVSLIVDNKQLTTNACGAMIQGRAKTFSVTRTILSILSLGPKVAGFSKKYPGMLSFYARGKGLPDERKLYKYRIIQVIPTKILYWIGYSFGRYIPARTRGRREALGLAKNSPDAAAVSQLFQSADEEIAAADSQVGHEWLVRLEDAVEDGRIGKDEKALLGVYRLSKAHSRSALSDEEKRLLKKWKKT